jgi:uncharacterized protein
MDIPFEQLWDTVVAQFACRTTSIHGPSHWRRVERNGLLLAEATGADIDIVRLFALFHDSRRESDGWDLDHGARAAEYAAELRGHAYELADDRYQKLQYACVWHTDGKTHEDPTIATCWDADRLDLGRVGVMPDPKRMCTPLGRHIAEIGGVESYLRNQPTKP